MEESIVLGHMSLCEDESDDGYYIPHHAVIKESSETTKLRPIYHASAKTTTGVSLNDVLIPGPTLQDTIYKQILRFRTHKYVVIADIEKMYKQILVHPDDRKYQKVFWYYQGKIKTFALNTVTFGVSCAPFLAIRTLHQLAHDEAADFPRGSKLLIHDFYVDDFISSANSIDEVLKIRDEMITLLSCGGFVIRQWAPNQVTALENIDKKILNLECGVKDSAIHKLLGIVWDSEKDVFTYKVKSVDAQVTSTKRKLVSEVAKIYDPLGLLGPVILYAKSLTQDCWKEKITWDESLPQNIHTKWESLANQLPCLQDFVTSRYLVCPDPIKIEVHGFCDACSKSRIAPLSAHTIPRLELSAAVMLKKLYVESRSQLDFRIDCIIFWSDSTIVLCWLKKAPYLLKTFESNRVAEIQTLGDQVEWRYVRSEDNPADSLSRGQSPSEFMKNLLWTSGPSWLILPEEDWPSSIEPSITKIPGLRKGVCLLTTSSFCDIYQRFSKFQQLVRTVAYVRRWKGIKLQGKRTRLLPEITDKMDRIKKIIGLVPPLLCSELILAERQIFSMIQHECYAKEIKLLETAQETELRSISVPFRKSTKFDEINPFLDEHGLIRVGGRLKKANLIFNQKHPLLLPCKHHVSDLLIRDIHERNLHAGIQSTLYTVRERFWILNGKNQIRSIIHRCIECIRQKPQMMHAQMADLPEPRVTEAPAFWCTGVDFFGHILIKEKKDRNRSFIKTYGCAFVCMASKAVHIELATDLSSKGFLAALRRFISRRGIPAHIYSDNGTNFVGANRELLEIYDLFKDDKFAHNH